MKLYTLSALLFLFLINTGFAAEADFSDCIGCHSEKTPKAYQLWKESAHGKNGISCDVCHGKDHNAITSGNAPVTQKICAKCHKKAYNEHIASRHGMGLHSGWGCTRNLPSRNKNECVFCHDESSAKPKSTVQCARFIKQSSEMGEAGCNRCHNVESFCSSCHTSHITDLNVVRDPASCAKCHMGPDHPQWEMWQTSMHGTLYSNQGKSTAPDCQFCHMPSGNHNVSQGITVTSGGIPLSENIAVPRRESMISICAKCHSVQFSKKELERGDKILKQTLSLVKEADAIVWNLFDKELLMPMPENRPPHPLSGNTLVTDSQLLYEDTSHIERLLFKLKKYDYAKTIKGAYHQNPAYTHWYGNAEVKMDLVDIKAEAARLESMGRSSHKDKKEEEKKLKTLKNKFERKAITEVEYKTEKDKILKELIKK